MSAPRNTKPNSPGHSRIPVPARASASGSRAAAPAVGPRGQEINPPAFKTVFVLCCVPGCIVLQHAPAGYRENTFYNEVASHGRENHVVHFGPTPANVQKTAVRVDAEGNVHPDDMVLYYSRDDSMSKESLLSYPGRIDRNKYLEL